MKKTGIYLLIASFILTGIGSILKIRHAQHADLLLGVGMLSLLIGIGLLIYEMAEKKAG
jgi:hypothetical protein